LFIVSSEIIKITIPISKIEMKKVNFVNKKYKTKIKNKANKNFKNSNDKVDRKLHIINLFNLIIP